MDECFMPAALWRCTRRTVTVAADHMTVAETQAQLRARRLVMKAERAARKQPAPWRDALRNACEGGADAILAQLACPHGSLSEAEQQLVLSSGSRPWDAFYARHATSGYRDRHYVRSFCRARARAPVSSWVSYHRIADLSPQLRREFHEIMPDAVRADPDRWTPCLEPAVDDAERDSRDSSPASSSDDEDKAGERGGDASADPDVDLAPPPRAGELPMRGWSLVGLETGCGVGNAVFPLLRAHPGLYMYACDFAPQAVALLRRRREYRAASRGQHRCHAFVADVTDAEALARGVGAWRDHGPHASSAERTLDFATVLFVLGAIPTSEARAAAMRSIAALLRPGGLIFYRDHGQSDLSQLRFAQQGRAIRRDGADVDGRLYARNDGTLAHFCTLEEVRGYAAGAGLDVLECEYRTSSVVNAKLGLNMRRVLVHAKMRKPSEGSSEDSSLAKPISTKGSY